MTRILRLISLFFLLSVAIAHAQPLNGTFTIGPESDYATFTLAVADLNSRGVNGPVTFNVLNQTYNEQIQITADGTATNTIIFQSSSGTASDVILTFAATGSSDNYVVAFSGCSYVTFKNMTLTAAGSSHGQVFKLIGTTNITIMDNVVNGVSSTVYNFDTQEIIHTRQSTPANANTVVSGNTINNGTIGVFLDNSSAGIQNGSEVTNNTFTNQYYRGISMNQQDSPQVNGNTISTNSTFSDFFAIRAVSCDNDLDIRKNKINLSLGTGILVVNGVGTSLNTGLIANNFVRVGDGGSAFCIGIQLQNNAYLNTYHNSVYINSSHPSFARAFYMASGGSNNAISNNIFSGQGAAGYAYYVLSGTGAAISSSDYNDFLGASSKFANWEGTNYATVAAFQAASSTDANSVSTSVNFLDVANGDLHLADGSVGNLTLAGTALSSVTNDIDGDIRTNTPYMGADEASTALPVELISFTYQATSTSVMLKWNTATETNNFGFEVDRSAGNSDWQKIGFVAGHGTTLQLQNYEFMDETVSSGSYSYRLKQIDTDGSFEFSNIISVNIGVPERFQLAQNFPNPFNPQTTIQYSIAEGGPVTLTIFNVLGGLVRQLVSEDQAAGEYSIAWAGKNAQGNLVSGGVYFYVLKVGSQTIARRRMTFLK